MQPNTEQTLMNSSGWLELKKGRSFVKHEKIGDKGWTVGFYGLCSFKADISEIGYFKHVYFKLYILSIRVYLLIYTVSKEFMSHNAIWWQENGKKGSLIPFFCMIIGQPPHKPQSM